MERVTATYLIETALPVAQAAATLAGEQSTGTFVAVPGETAGLKERHAARVEKITERETVAAPALPTGRASAASYRRAEVTVSWPVENFGFNLPTLVSTLQGNLYELAQFSGLKLMDFTVPPAFAAHFRGPAFGVAGCRKLTGVTGRPLIGTIIKPSIGLTPEQTAAMVQVLVGAGIDFLKDDELMADPPHSPFDARVDAVMRVINAHADRTGKKAMYAFNLSGESDAMRRHYDKIVAAGGTCAMLSLNSVGLSASKAICDRGALAIHGHRNGWGQLNRHPLLGIEFPAYQKLWRLAGVDQLHVNGIANKFWESDDSVVRSIASCLATEPLGKPVLPVVSSGQWGGQAPETWRRTQTVDLLYMAGGGIQAHPDGPAAGVQSLQLWWRAAVEGLTAGQAAAKYPALAQSVAKFGKPAAPAALRLAFYADDFTGSTDALESLAAAGLRTRLFLAPPTAAQCAGLDAVGVAGLTRSLAPAAMEAELRPAFAALRALGPRHVHYKVCSTFDSSPAVGSIGRAIEVGAEIFRGRTVPLLVAAPALGRYGIFGQLHARYGTAGTGAVHRLDRHPAISRHPVTPMTEADLRVHLAAQTKKKISLLSVLDLERAPAETTAALEALIAGGAEVVLIDGVNDAHLRRAGALLDGLAGDGPFFSVGSSGLEAGLTAHWGEIGRASPPDEPPLAAAQRGRFALPASVQPLLVVSGSCSAVTAGQIDWALANGFTGIKYEGEGSTAAAIAALKAGKHVLVYTSRGEAGAPIPASVLGAQLGRLAREVIAQAGLTRLVVAGGDTSSYAARALGIASLEMLAPLVPGAPWCRASAPGSPADGLTVNFKGGQVGAPDYFGAAAAGNREN